MEATPTSFHLPKDQKSTLHKACIMHQLKIWVHTLRCSMHRHQRSSQKRNWQEIRPKKKNNSRKRSALQPRSHRKTNRAPCLRELQSWASHSKRSKTRQKSNLTKCRNNQKKIRVPSRKNLPWESPIPMKYKYISTNYSNKNSKLLKTRWIIKCDNTKKRIKIR